MEGIYIRVATGGDGGGGGFCFEDALLAEYCTLFVYSPGESHHM